MNKSRGYHPFEFATSESVLINNDTPDLIYDTFKFNNPASSFNLKFRATNLHSNPLKHYQYIDHEKRPRKIKTTEWGFFFKTNEEDTLKITISFKEIKDAIESFPALDIRYEYNGKRENCTLKSGVDFYDGANTWLVETKDGNVKISTGNRKLTEIININIGNEKFLEFGFFAGKGCLLKITDIAITDILYSNHINPIYSSNEIEEKINSVYDSFTGYWVMFDRDLEESLLKLGGDYKLAMIPENEKYLLIYISGAKVNPSEWIPGKVKCILSPTPFDDIFDVEWIDAEGNSLGNDIKAQKGEGNTLTFQLPYHSSSFRLRKIP